MTLEAVPGRVTASAKQGASQGFEAISVSNRRDQLKRGLDNKRGSRCQKTKASSLFKKAIRDGEGTRMYSDF